MFSQTAWVVLLSAACGLGQTVAVTGYRNASHSAVDASGNIYLAGDITTKREPLLMAGAATYRSTNIVVAKLDSTGGELWAAALKFYDATLLALAPDSAGNVYVVGLGTLAPLPDFDGGEAGAVWVVKIAAAGDRLLWGRKLGVLSNDLRIAVGADGGLFVAGSYLSTLQPTVSPLGPNPRFIPPFVLKIKPDGSAIEFVSYAGTGASTFVDFAVDSMGGMYFLFSGMAEERIGPGGGRSSIDKVSTNGGQTWTTVRTSATEFRPSVTSVHPLTPTTLFAARSGSQIERSVDGGATWNPWGQPFAGGEYISALRIHPLKPERMWALVRRQLTARLALHRSDDGGLTWTEVDTGFWVYYFDIDPYNADRVFATSHEIFGISEDSGKTWTRVADRAPGYIDVWYSVTVSPTNPQRLYAQTDWSLAVSPDGGRTWEARFPPGFNRQQGIYPSSGVVFDPADGKTLYSVWRSRPIRSTDDGVTWTQLARTTCAMVNVQAFAFQGKTTLIGETSCGPHRSLDGGITWSAPADAEIRQSDTVVVLSPSNLSRIYARLSRRDDVSVVKLSPGASKLEWTTAFGGFGYEYPAGIGVDCSGRVYVSGLSTSPDFPAEGSERAAFIAGLTADGKNLRYLVTAPPPITALFTLAANCSGDVVVGGGRVEPAGAEWYEQKTAGSYLLHVSSYGTVRAETVAADQPLAPFAVWWDSSNTARALLWAGRTSSRLVSFSAGACTVALTGDKASFGEGRATGTIAITASTADCPWTIESDQSWFQLYPLSGKGSGTVQYTAYPNFDTTVRTTLVHALGRELEFTQAAGTGTARERFVRKLYFGFIGRDPGPSEVAFHANSAVSNEEMAWRFLHSEEFNRGGRFVAGLYVGILNRDAEFTGWQFQRNALTSNIVSQDQLVANFLGSAEFTQKHGTLSNADFIRLLYRQILLRDANADEVQFHVGTLSALSRVQVTRNFLNSAEFRQGTGPRLTRFLLFATLALRDPSPADTLPTSTEQQIRNVIAQIVGGI